MFSSQAQASILVAVAGKTLTSWVQETEMFYHKMLTIAVELEKYLEARKTKSGRKGGALERLQKKLEEPFFEPEHAALPVVQNGAYNGMLHMGLITPGVILAPDSILNEVMKRQLVKIKENIGKLLSKMTYSPVEGEQGEVPVPAPVEEKDLIVLDGGGGGGSGAGGEEEKTTDLGSVSGSDGDGEDEEEDSEDDQEEDHGPLPEPPALSSIYDPTADEEDREVEYVKVQDGETIVDELKRKFSGLNTEIV
jgi:hypothetical protein